MLVVSLNGINQEFWSHLECLGLNVTIFRCQNVTILKNSDFYFHFST